jgi:ribosomal protein S18 acetylase RimI-like enzyme
MNNPGIRLEPSSPAYEKFIVDQIIDYNLQFVGSPFESYNQPISYMIKDAKDAVIAGINGTFYVRSTLHVDILWVAQEHRQSGYGSQLLQAAEQEAKSRGGQLVHLSTYDFQAKDFYLKHGYEIFGTLDDCPAPGRRRFYVRKTL